MEYRKLIVSLLVVTVLVVSAAGCGGSETLSPGPTGGSPAVTTTPPPPTTPPPDVILKSMTASSAGMNTYEGKLLSTMAMSLAGMNMNFDISASMAVDMPGKKTFVTMTTAGVTTQMYVINDTEYIMVNVPDGELQANVWYKLVLPAADLQDMWLSQDMGDQFQILFDQATLSILGAEAVAGIQCYKVKVTPDINKFMTYLDASGSNLADMGITNPAQVFKQIDVTLWVDKTSFMPAKMDMTMVADTQGMTLNMTMSMTFEKVNQPINIALPAAAQTALPLS